MDKLDDDVNEYLEYEILAQEIYKQLLKADGFENIDVQHNIKVPGRSGCNHQIDVYWEFKLGGEIYRVAIECKNYAKEVSIARIRDFFGVIHDIGNVKGIFITKKGFQSGAKIFADYYNISLKELRPPKDKDWKGRLKTIIVEINLMPINITKVFVEPDYNWMINRGLIKSEDDGKKIIIETNKLNTDICVYDHEGNVINNFLELEEKLPHDYQSGKGFKHAYKYPNAFMESNFGRIKINQIGFKYDINTISTEIVLEAEEVTKAIIKDVSTGKINFIKKDGSIK